MLVVKHVSDVWLWPLVAAALACLDAPLLARGLLAAGVSNTLLVLIKSTVQRPRPADVLALEARASHRPFFRSDGSSFPSGHALNAFTVGTLVAMSHPGLALPIGAGALAIVASRLLLGLHFLSDVVAGALLGWLVGLAMHAWL
jgi:undecaprenyl-diphosphatase